jgi:hypothetical protein
LANLFLHYAFDAWMKREHRDIPFERYADDVICHCRTEEQALKLQAALAVDGGRKPRESGGESGVTIAFVLRRFLFSFFSS